ncbi:hypothetical protein THAOC_35222 [Thalassiosira oceanica]|uniref:CobW/HypB/UreG nucleotide-binding domain-containing protein n=1 Tax=Thalassiosira oceanica TaxID=159749 RepID=K0R192_THAOC|nr:hypothetical protein THAOC_35222 [Thalassiosira oceanica]|eukprot:EJK46128.1 hypothetical protein THAOC_35222 [Thalassiosira oceanica]
MATADHAKMKVTLLSGFLGVSPPWFLAAPHRCSDGEDPSIFRRRAHDCVSCVSSLTLSAPPHAPATLSAAINFTGWQDDVIEKNSPPKCNEEDKLKMAVIVNDMGEVNLDAEEIKSTKMIQEDAEMVEMQNGCICCTLRGDLLKTVKKLSEEGQFDYLVIESTGIGEPLPVAQTFTMDVDEMTPKDGKLKPAEQSMNSLHHYAKLDTCVTVVDGLNIFEVLGSIETLADADNISGMLGNTGAKDGNDSPMDVTELSPEQEAAKKQVVEKVLGFNEKVLRNLLESRELSTEGDKEAMANRLIAAFEKEVLGQMEPPVDDRAVSRLWLDQIEFANVIVVSKVHQLLEQGEAGETKLINTIDLIQKLNPKAKIVAPRQDKYGDLDVFASILDTGLFDMEEAQMTSKWQQELAAEEHTAETEEYGISSLMFVEDEAPFHPVRLAKIMRGFGDYEDAVRAGKSDDDVEEEVSGSSLPNVFKGVVRTKGHIWLANANAFPISFQSAGAHIDMRPSDNPFLWEVDRKLNEIEKEKNKEIEEKKGDGSEDDIDMEYILGTPVTDGFKKMVRSQVQLHKSQGLWTKDNGALKKISLTHTQCWRDDTRSILVISLSD